MKCSCSMFRRNGMHMHRFPVPLLSISPLEHQPPYGDAHLRLLKVNNNILGNYYSRTVFGERRSFDVFSLLLLRCCLNLHRSLYSERTTITNPKANISPHYQAH
uniref:Uncharacterized protein n=1 Tax=Schistocephalus solidus TaxID=70667 RepID=A0A0X3PG48_SCHSO